MHIPDVDTLLADRNTFNDFVYTSFEDAVAELAHRKKHPIPMPAIKVPDALSHDPRFVIFRHIATPNYEIRRFMSAADASGVKPLIFEYTSDVFLSVNPWKYSLAKLPFYKGLDKKGGIQTVQRNIIDFNTSNRKSFSDIKTLWGQGLVDFHHEFFLKHFPEHGESIYDLSQWLKENGHNPKEYYKSFLRLFINNAILFENFILEGDELIFTKEVILPALREIVEETGHKPLIVALEPTEIEDDLFWLCHPVEDKGFVKDKMVRIKGLPQDSAVQ